MTSPAAAAPSTAVQQNQAGRCDVERQPQEVTIRRIEGKTENSSGRRTCMPTREMMIDR